MLFYFGFRIWFFFFFQAEDGIRDIGVTGVQTCALPICPCSSRLAIWKVEGSCFDSASASRRTWTCWANCAVVELPAPKKRSEERRVGKECRSRRWPDGEKKRKESVIGTSGKAQDMQKRR